MFNAVIRRRQFTRHPQTWSTAETFFWLISAHIGNARSAVKSATAGTPSIPTACRGALRRGLCGRSYLSYLRADPLILPKIHKVRRPSPASIFWFFMRFLFPIQAGGSHTQAAPLHVSSSRTPARFSPYAGAVLPCVSTATTISTRRRRSPYLQLTPHTFPRIPHITAKLQKPDIGFDETSVSGSANQTSAGLHKFPASPASAVPHVQARHQPAETSVRLTQT